MKSRQLLLLLGLTLPAPIHAQLLAPGKLATPHASLDGIRNCTSCHALGSAGAVDDRCLECHELIRNRVAVRTGYHATLRDRRCGSCHKDHFGRDFDLVRLDTTSFNHADAGWSLRGAHGENVGCRDCHQPSFIRAADVRAEIETPRALARTYLGLETTCESCHEQDGPHGTQFADRECTDCHVETTWSDLAPFDHGSARYPLTGLHRKVTCDGCHRPASRGTGVRYRGIAFSSCTSCHTDPHAGVMGTACDDCHGTAGWDRVDGVDLRGRFDHSATGFELVGSHASLDCPACHERTRPQPEGIHLTFAAARARSKLARPVAERCGSCHIDYHAGVFAEQGTAQECQSCHGEDAWLPTSYGIERHNRESRFNLTGAHLATPCTVCHAGATPSAAPVFRLTGLDCVDCHSDGDPHAGQFAEPDCVNCHDTHAFAPSTFDHETARFTLDGAHSGVSCPLCHFEEIRDGKAVRRYRPLDRECRDCHGGAR